MIAVVTEAWEDSTAEANRSFWRYRLELILEKTRGIDVSLLTIIAHSLARDPSRF